jgi:hypothetical protein
LSSVIGGLYQYQARVPAAGLRPFAATLHLATPRAVARGRAKARVRQRLDVGRYRRKTEKVRVPPLRLACVALLASGCTGDAYQKVLSDLAAPSCFEIRYEYPAAHPEELYFPADPYGRPMPGPFVRLVSDSASTHPRRDRVEVIDPTGERAGPLLSGWEVLSRDSIKLWWTQGNLVTTWYRLRVTRRDLDGRAWYETDKTESARFEIPGRQVQFLRRSCEGLSGPAAAAEARLIHFGPHPTDGSDGRGAARGPGGLPPCPEEHTGGGAYAGCQGSSVPTGR